MTIKVFGSESEGSAGFAERWSHAEGRGSVASGLASHAEGNGAVASANYSSAGGFSGARADAWGQWARSSSNVAGISASRAQVSIYSLSCQTAASTGGVLTMDGAGSSGYTFTGATTNMLVIPAGGTYLFSCMVVARKLGAAVGASSAGWIHDGVMARETGGTARLVGAVTQEATWSDLAIGTVSYTASTTNNCLQISVASSIAFQVIWHAVLTVNELVTTS